MPRVTGDRQARARLRGLAGQEKIAEVGRALYAGGDLIRVEASRLLTEGSVSGKFHVPSLPGEPPNEDTGHLRSNIEVHQTAPLRVEVSSNAKYAAALEGGTSKMAERPYMGPAARAKKKEIVKLVQGAVSIVVRRR